MINKVVTITGPSAGGKTEFVKRLSASKFFDKLVNVTTREMRPGEVNGSDYYFINEDSFTYLEKEEQLVQQVNFHGKNYATTKDEIVRVFKLGKIPVVIVEPGGVKQFESVAEELGFKVYSVFITAPYETLKQRYLSRIDASNLSSQDSIRLAAIESESEEWKDKHNWDVIFTNSSNDLSDIDWMCGNLLTLVRDLDK